MTGTPGLRSEKPSRCGHLAGLDGCKEVNQTLTVNFFLFNEQINMQKKMRLTGIITQGASRMGAAEYIKAFKVASSLDGNVYSIYRVEGQWRDKVRRPLDVLLIQSSTFDSLPTSCAAGFPWQHGQRQHKDQPVRPPRHRSVRPHHPCDLPQGVHAAHGAGWV